MPELTDVEVARRHLESWMRGASVASAQSSDERIVGAPGAFRKALVGKRVRAVRRRGKWLRIDLDDGARVYSHLGMTGDWVRRDGEASRESSERARIDLVAGAGRRRSVRYLDRRRFGRLVVAREDIPEWRELGPDPLLDGIDVQRLSGALGRSRRSVKSVLLDQSVLAGIGNILATETLWQARIDPRSRSDALTKKDVDKLVRGLRAVIQKDLRKAAAGDASHDRFSIYGRAGRPCPRCRTPLAHAVLDGRGTTFCERCQVRRR